MFTTRLVNVKTIRSKRFGSSSDLVCYSKHGNIVIVVKIIFFIFNKWPMNKMLNQWENLRQKIFKVIISTPFETNFRPHNYLGFHGACMFTAAMTNLYAYFSNKISGFELTNIQWDETLPRIGLLYPSHCCNEMHELQPQRYDMNFCTLLRLVNALHSKSGITY